MFLRDFWNKHIWDTEGSTCRQACMLVSVSRVLPSDPILVDRQVLGSYEVGWPNKASICWNLSWVTLWHLTVLPTGLKRQVESSLEIDILMICFVIYFLKNPVSTDVANDGKGRSVDVPLLRLQQAEAAGEQEVFGVWVVFGTKMLIQRWDMLVPWRITKTSGTIKYDKVLLQANPKIITCQDILKHMPMAQKRQRNEIPTRIPGTINAAW